MEQEDFELALISVGDDPNLNLKFCTASSEYLDSGFSTVVRVPVTKDPLKTLGEIEAEGRTKLAEYLRRNG